MAEAGKTSTFTIHHDRCKPDTWTPSDVLALATFVKYGDLRYAARLSRLGVQLVLSEHHEIKGGEIEHLGYAKPDALEEFAEIGDVADDDDITEVVPVYRGQSVFAVRYGTGDSDGNFEGWEHEIKTSKAEAEEYLKGINEEIERQSAVSKAKGSA